MGTPTFTCPDPGDQSRAALLSLIQAHGLSRGTFKLTSGRMATYHIDLRPLALDAWGSKLVGACLGRLIRDHFPEAQGVGGLLFGALPIALAVVQATGNLQPFAVRAEAQKHGRGQRIERALGLKPGAAVVIVDDVATTGTSLLEAAAAAQEYGFAVAGVAVIVDREEGARERVERQAPFLSVFTAREVLGG